MLLSHNRATQERSFLFFFELSSLSKLPYLIECFLNELTVDLKELILLLLKLEVLFFYLLNTLFELLNQRGILGMSAFEMSLEFLVVDLSLSSFNLKKYFWN